MVRVTFDLVTNPKACRSKPFVAKIKNLETGELEFLKPVIPEYSKKGTLIAGEYELEPFKYYIVRKDSSSWKNSCQTYELYYVSNGNVSKLAAIYFVNKNVEFSDEEIREIYTNTKNGRRAIDALIEYARRHKMKNSFSIEDIIRSEISTFIKKLEEKYNVKIKIDVVVEK